mgnify:CR=1 FL=1
MDGFDRFGGLNLPPLYDDEYTGPRWRYGITYRPVDLSGVPPGFIVGSHRPDQRFPRFGTIAYPRELSAREIKQFELTPSNVTVDVPVYQLELP